VPDDDTEDLSQALRNQVSTYNHPVGTCGMGPDPDQGAVVDARARVHGVEELVVADASIMPSIPAAPTNLPTIMIAERVAVWLAGTWGKEPGGRSARGASLTAGEGCTLEADKRNLPICFS
jgi:choline dehydrogenase